MMAGVQLWLRSVLAVSLLCALADALTPQGGVKRVQRLVCGLVLAAAALGPAVRLDVEGGRRWLETCLEDLELRRDQLEEETGMKSIIERSFAAYIVDKAAQLGLSPVQARVECREEDGVYLPQRLWVSGPLAQEEREELSRALEEELGVAREAQTYDEEEKP